jgi:aspartokinase
MLQTVRLIKSSTYSMRDVIAGYGEIWSTRLFAPYLRERNRIKGDVCGSMRAKSSSSSGDRWVLRCNGP